MSKKKKDEQIEEEIIAEELEEITEEVVEEKTELEILEEKLQESEDKFLRQRAEFDNYKKRTTMDILSASEKGKAEVLKNVLETVDILEKALEHDSTDEAFKTGIESVYKNLMDKLLSLGLKEVDCTGKLDAKHHHAIAVDAESELEADSITEVFQKGYYLNEELIRPAMVKVAL